jgi:anti-sigma factor RsiW
MLPHPDQQRLTPDERSNLVAYLDGELDEVAARTIATILTKSPTARHEVATLQKTWELLDFLPLPTAAEHFSERTVTEIRKLEFQTPVWRSSVGAWSSIASRVAITGSVAVLSLGIGYLATRWAVPDPTARVAQNLTLAEHLDEYLQIGSFEFLSKLVDSPEFATDPR